MRIKAGILFLVLLVVGPSFATTWHVEKDGSGDYSIIQDAVDVAAEGDTVFVGLGRFEEYETLDIVLLTCGPSWRALCPAQSVTDWSVSVQLFVSW